MSVFLNMKSFPPGEMPTLFQTLCVVDASVNVTGKPVLNLLGVYILAWEYEP